MHVSMRMLVFVYMCVCMYIVYLILWCVSSCCSFIILISIVITKFLQLFNKNQSCNNSYLLVFRRRLHALSLFLSFSLSHSISRSLLSSSQKKTFTRAHYFNRCAVVPDCGALQNFHGRVVTAIISI